MDSEANKMTIGCFVYLTGQMFSKTLRRNPQKGFEMG